MKTATAGHVAAEELMALADGELTGAALRAVQEHVETCAACAAQVTAFHDQQSALAAWTVNPMPEAVEQAIEQAVLAEVRRWGASTPPAKESRSPRGAAWSARGWAWGGAGALAVGALALIFVTHIGGTAHYVAPQGVAVARLDLSADKSRASESKSLAQAPSAAPPSPSQADTTDKAVEAAPAAKMAAPLVAGLARSAPSRMRPAQPVAAEVDAPMIARTVALTLTVKDVERSREGLDNLLRAYGGYAAQMEVSTPEGGTRSLTASLRVPAAQMRGLLAELKGYGKVENETQSGEEVGQQHADLAARLNTSRASEERLRGILKTRTGDVSEVLEVEEQIATVREQIEQMEAEQQGLEHRVSYATIDLTMNEEGQGPAARTIGSRLAAGARAGWNNATEAVVGLMTFLLEYGLAAVLVAALLGLPAWWLWRRWRRAQARW